MKISLKEMRTHEGMSYINAHIAKVAESGGLEKSVLTRPTSRLRSTFKPKEHKIRRLGQSYVEPGHIDFFDGMLRISRRISFEERGHSTRRYEGCYDKQIEVIDVSSDVDDVKRAILAISQEQYDGTRTRKGPLYGGHQYRVGHPRIVDKGRGRTYFAKVIEDHVWSEGRSDFVPGKLTKLLRKLEKEYPYTVTGVTVDTGMSRHPVNNRRMFYGDRAFLIAHESKGKEHVLYMSKD